ncbi:MAG: hypothetical protein AB7R89_13675 [Dehalococcoidia bacterium]
MASHVARAERNHEVRKRLDAVLGQIAARLGIEIPPEPRRMKDPGLQPIVELERFTTILEDVLAALPEPDAAKPAQTADTPPARRSGGRTRS